MYMFKLSVFFCRSCLTRKWATAAKPTGMSFVVHSLWLYRELSFDAEVNNNWNAALKLLNTDFTINSPSKMLNAFYKPVTSIWRGIFFIKSYLLCKFDDTCSRCHDAASPINAQPTLVATYSGVEMKKIFIHHLLEQYYNKTLFCLVSPLNSVPSSYNISEIGKQICSQCYNVTF